MQNPGRKVKLWIASVCTCLSQSSLTACCTSRCLARAATKTAEFEVLIAQTNISQVYIDPGLIRDHEKQQLRAFEPRETVNIVHTGLLRGAEEPQFEEPDEPEANIEEAEEVYNSEPEVKLDDYDSDDSVEIKC